MYIFTTASALFFLLCAHEATASRYLFVFGDSYTDTGFDITSTKPANRPKNQLGNPAEGTHTSCSNSTNPCPLWIEVLTDQNSTADTVAYNFAVSGSVIDEKAINVTAGDTFTNQEGNWSSTVGSKPPPSYAPWNANNSAAIMWFGANDMLQLINFNQSQSQKYIDADTDVLFHVMQSIYNQGVRLFVIMGCPPVDLTPGIQFEGKSDGAKSNITYWNQDLKNKAPMFQQFLANSTVKFIDTRPFFTAVINDPSKQPWYNYYHPNRDTHVSIANGTYLALKSYGFYK